MNATPRLLARRVALATFLTLALTGAGRIAGSDEVTMFEVARAMLAGRIDVPVGATLTGPDGRHYSKNHAGQAVIALPIVALGEGAARLSGLSEPRQRLMARAVASGCNAIVVALLAGAIVTLAVRLGASPAAAAGAAAGAVFTTPLWVYGKSFMAEPLQALGLLLAVVGAALACEATARPAADRRRAAWLSATGVLIALSAKASMCLPLLAGVAATGVWRERAALRPLAAFALALIGHLAYNHARFGDPLQSGYGAQASLAAFSTPLLVGLHGLLFSSGKGLAWFAPLAWLAPWGAAAMLQRRAHRDTPRAVAAHAAARGALAAVTVLLVQSATFQHWAGDGSWGPRYLVPAVPLLMVLVAFALTGASAARRRIAWALAAAGVLVQLGGVGVYYGVQMRVAGDYPYARPLEDPRSLESSHWNPRFSPIAGHWQLLARDLREHFAGDWPRVQADGGDARLGVSEQDQRALWRGIDLWWLYAAYAGVPFAPLAAAALMLLASSLWAWSRVAAALRGGAPA